ncbi:MAG: hypothetical protein QHJ81_00370 [Anaerolineae bacterium]|nr:hypothetical protein [Anaerolineae bacterium]
MLRKRSVPMIAVFLSLALVCSLTVGCRGREAPPEKKPLHINLPRISIAYDEQGEPSVLGTPLKNIERLMRSDLSMLRLSPELVRQLMDWGVQHAEVAVAPDGLFLFVNNKPLPYLAWDEQILANVGAKMDKLGVLPPTVARYITLERALPALVRTLGIGLVLKMPVASGQEALPFEEHADGAPVPPVEVPEEKLVSLQVPLEYDETGQPSVDGIKLRELGKLTGQPMAIGELDPATLATLSQAEVENMFLRMEGRGLVPYVDGQQMPYINWADEYLLNLLDLVEKARPDLPPFALDAVRRAVPGIKEADIRVQAKFRTP